MGYIFSQILIMSFICTGFYMLFKMVSILFDEKLSKKWEYYSLLFIFSLALIPYFKPFQVWGYNQKSFIGTKIYMLAGVNRFQIVRSFSAISTPNSTNENLLYRIFPTRLITIYISYIWVSGIAIYILIYLYKYLQFHKMLKKFKNVNSDELEKLIISIESQLKAKHRDIPILTNSSYYGTPFICRIIFPCVIVPNIDFTSEQWNVILSHELTHYKRRDEIFKIVITVLNSVQWFNPVIYFIRRDIDAYCELACDEFVTEKMSAFERRRYCELILDIISDTMDRESQMYSAFNDRRKLERRVKNIMGPSTSKFKKAIRLIASMLTLTMAFCATNLAAYAAQSTYPSANFKVDSYTQPLGSTSSSTLSSASENTEVIPAAPVSSKSVATSLLSSAAAASPNTTTTPVNYWNLAVGNYNGAFSGVSYIAIYTNYYFTPNSNKTIYLDQVVTGEESSSQKYYVALYDMNTGTPVYQNEFTVSNTTEYTLTYNNLNANHFYFMAWKAAGANQLIDGNFTVRWN